MATSRDPDISLILTAAVDRIAVGYMREFEHSCRRPSRAT